MTAILDLRKDLKILIVDDDAEIRSAIFSIVSSIHPNVECCDDGEEALAAMAAKEFDILITDVRMPKLDGISLLEKLATLGARRPKTALLITGWDDKSYLRRAMAAGAIDYIDKPFDHHSLEVRIERAIADAHLKKALAMTESRCIEMLSDFFGFKSRPLEIDSPPIERLKALNSLLDIFALRLINMNVAKKP